MERSEKNGVLKTPTFKSGRFVFSRKFDEHRLAPRLARVETLRETLRELPMLPAWASRIDEELLVKGVRGTAAVENNPLSESQVRILARGGALAPNAASERHEREVRNLLKVYGHLSGGGTEETPWRMVEETVRRLHGWIVENLDETRNPQGAYRHFPVVVGDAAHGGTYRPPKTLDDVRLCMREFADWVRSGGFQDLSPLLQAPLAHYHLASIHPFADGNGRTARLYEALLYIDADYAYLHKNMSNFYYRNVDEYFSLFRRCQKNTTHDMTEFLEWQLGGVETCLHEIKFDIVQLIKRLIIRDTLRYRRKTPHWTAQQTGLLEIFLDAERAETLPELLERAAVRGLYPEDAPNRLNRDLEALLRQHRVIKDEYGRFSINLDMLE